MTCHGLCLALVTLGVSGMEVDGQIEHIPKPGSPERQAICDAARGYVLRKYATAPLPQPIVFKIDHLRVLDDYCNFEAIPLFKDGSYVAPRYIPDIGLNFCLRKTGSDWSVIVDLSRTDVPDGAELATIKRTLPADFRSPFSLLHGAICLTNRLDTESAEILNKRGAHHLAAPSR